MAVSQDFEARRRERLKEQRKKREREKRIQRIALIIAIAFLAFFLIFNIVQCSKKKEAEKNNQNTAQTQTDPNSITLNSDTTGSGEFHPSIPKPKEGSNDYLDIITESGQTNHVYLTFDNGPSESVTPAILDILRRYNVKATFFMNGIDIKDNPHLCTRAIEEGHLVLPLSKSGNADILYADKITFIDEVEKTYEIISENAPNKEKPIKLYRFLGGSFAGTRYSDKIEQYKATLAEEGYYYCDWNASIGDSTPSRTSEQLLTYFNNNRPSVNNLIIQMNNTDQNMATVNMLGGLIEQLLSEGYTFSRLDEIEFINEIEREEDEEQLDGNAVDDEDKPSSTKSPSATNKPSSTNGPKTTTKPTATSTPKSTKKPTATSAPSTPKPVATPKPATQPPALTPAPQTATLPPSQPSNSDEIKSE